MLTLILGISLGLLLLFVLVLFVTEIAATYPVWKHFSRDASAYTEEPPEQSRPMRGRSFPKTVWVILGILCLIVLATAFGLSINQPAPVVKEQKTTQDLQPKVMGANSAGYSAFFQLHTKWEGGKLYGNSTVTFHTDSVKVPTECRFFLLDKDDFLVKSISFSPADFVWEVGSGPPRLVCRFNADMSSDDYLKIEKLQVAVDGKVPGYSSNGGN